MDYNSHASVGRPAKTYIHQLCVDTRYGLGMDGEKESKESMLLARLNDDD